VLNYLTCCRLTVSEGKGREGKGREGKGREGKGREGKGREVKVMEGKYLTNSLCCLISLVMFAN